jgi:hypothetical protein
MTATGRVKVAHSFVDQLAYSQNLRDQLPSLLSEHHIGLMVDVACGDFGWLSDAQIPGVVYVGMDSSVEVVESNKRIYESPARKFIAADFTRERPPPADLIFCRDAIFRKSYEDIYKILLNFVNSSATWLLMSSHRLHNNKDIEAPRKWRQLNLQRPPFNFPKAEAEIEDWIEGHPRRYMGLWRMEDVKSALENSLIPQPRSQALQVLQGRDTMSGRRTSVDVLRDVKNRVHALDFVTIVYRAEVLLLKLQARSFRINVGPGLIRSINIIINDDEPSTLKLIEDFAKTEYGQHFDKVKIWPYSDFMSKRDEKGWRKQQTLKLLFARQAGAELYIALDAKNHFIRPVNMSDFVSDSGKPLSFWTIQNGSLRNYLRNSLNYFGLGEEISTARVMPATTPYALYSELVKDMLSEIEVLEKVSFDAFFHQPGRDVSEFFLYFSYVMRRFGSPEELYSFSRRNTVTLFTRWPDTEAQQMEVLHKLDNSAIKIFGLHKNRINALNSDARRLVIRSWVGARLFKDEAAADAYFAALAVDIEI